MRTYPAPPLRDEVVLLRPWERGDAPCAAEGRNTDEWGALEWIERQWARLETRQGVSLAMADPATQEAAGYVGLIRRPKLERGTLGTLWSGEAGDLALVFAEQPGSAGIGYWVLERSRGRGLASHAVALLARWALVEGGLERVEALVEPGNAASIRVAERAGFTFEGRLRAYLEEGGGRSDALVYSLLRGDIA
jgi:[ribosomal protein S5]-alanine N-acetyltransferase